MSDFSSVFDRAKPIGKEPELNFGTPQTHQFWARVELMGHRVRYGFVQEVEMFGAKLLRIDVHTHKGPETEIYGGSAIYCVSPASEAHVKAEAEAQYDFHPHPPRAIAHHVAEHDPDFDERPF